LSVAMPFGNWTPRHQRSLSHRHEDGSCKENNKSMLTSRGSLLDIVCEKIHLRPRSNHQQTHSAKHVTTIPLEMPQKTSHSPGSPCSVGKSTFFDTFRSRSRTLAANTVFGGAPKTKPPRPPKPLTPHPSASTGHVGNSSGVLFVFPSSSRNCISAGSCCSNLSSMNNTNCTTIGLRHSIDVNANTTTPIKIMREKSCQQEIDGVSASPARSLLSSSGWNYNFLSKDKLCASPIAIRSQNVEFSAAPSSSFSSSRSQSAVVARSPSTHTAAAVDHYSLCSFPMHTATSQHQHHLTDSPHSEYSGKALLVREVGSFLESRHVPVSLSHQHVLAYAPGECLLAYS
jgi:hypothetical protein